MWPYLCNPISYPPNRHQNQIPVPTKTFLWFPSLSHIFILSPIATTFYCAHITHAYCIRFITIILVITTVLVVHGSSNSSSSSSISKFYVKSSSDPRRRRRKDGCRAAGFRIIDSSWLGWACIQAGIAAFHHDHDHSLWYQNLQCSISIPYIFALAGLGAIYHVVGVHMCCHPLRLNKQWWVSSISLNAYDVCGSCSFPLAGYRKLPILSSLRISMRHLLFSYQDHHLLLVWHINTHRRPVLLTFKLQVDWKGVGCIICSSIKMEDPVVQDPYGFHVTLYRHRRAFGMRYTNS